MAELSSALLVVMVLTARTEGELGGAQAQGACGPEGECATGYVCSCGRLTG